MSKSPHTPEFRAMVSQEYLEGLGSYDFLSNKYQIGSQTLKQWVAKYRLYGLLVFQDKKGNTSYSSDFKTTYENEGGKTRWESKRLRYQRIRTSC